MSKDKSSLSLPEIVEEIKSLHYRAVLDVALLRLRSGENAFHAIYSKLSRLLTKSPSNTKPFLV